MSTLRLDVTERVAWLTLDKLPQNLLDAAGLRELDMALDEVAAKSEVSILVVSGAGSEAFSGGLDIDGVDPAKLAGLLKAFHAIVKKLVKLPQAVVMAVDGVAYGAGLELAMLGDIVVASDRSRLGLPQIRLGGMPVVATLALPTLCGRPAACDLIFTGGGIDANRAKAIGLVSRVFSAEEFEEGLRGIVTRLAEQSPTVLKLTAQTTRARWLAGFDAALDAAEKSYLAELAHEPDMAEGLKAAQEERKPLWR